MAGACAPSLSIAVANAGGLGGVRRAADAAGGDPGVGREFRAGTNGAVPAQSVGARSAAARDPAHEAQVREFLAGWGPPVPPEAGDATPPDFAAQCEALLSAAPPIVSSVMGLYPPDFVARLKAHGHRLVRQRLHRGRGAAAEAAGADVVVAQGMEAGGHRGGFDAAKAEAEMVGLFALLPAVVDAVRSRWWRPAASPMAAAWRRR